MRWPRVLGFWRDHLPALSRPGDYFMPIPCCVFYHPFFLYETREKGGGRDDEKEISGSEIGILSSYINLLFFLSTLQESKYCEEPDLRWAMEWNCTLDIKCINEILGAYWLPMMLLLNQSHAGLLYSDHGNEESPRVFSFLYPSY